MRGYLGDLEDKDWFAVTLLTTGKLTMHVRAPAGVDVILLHGGETTRPDSKQVVNRRGPGGDEELTLDAVAGRPILVCVARKTALKGKADAVAKGERPDAKDQAPPGLDESYELRADPAR